MSDDKRRDTSDAVTEAQRLAEERERLRAELQIGVDELDRGEGIDADIVFRELDEKIAKLLKNEPDSRRAMPPDSGPQNCC